MFKALFLSLSALLVLVLVLGSGCYNCRPQCDDYLRVIPAASLSSGLWPPTSTYRIEIILDGSHFECTGHFKSEGEDEWSCPDGIEAHSRIKWEMPTFVIDGGREVKDAHVKIFREGVVIFDDAIDIDWGRNDASTDIQPCENLGCWSGIIQANIQDFDGLPEDDG